MNVSVVPLGELCELDRQGLRPDDPVAPGLPYVGVEHVGSSTGVIDFNKDSRVGTQKSTTFRFDERHVLYAKLRPYLNKVATPDFTGKCSTELVPLLPRDGVDRSFLAHLLRRSQTVDFVMASVTGSRMPRTDMKALLTMPVPRPPLDEQRRIVAILNRAAKIARLRAQAQKRLREFVLALFVKMFGDPGENPMGWPKRKIEEVCIPTQQRDPTKDPEREFRYVDISGIDSIQKTITKVHVLLGEDAPSRARKEIREGDIVVSSVRPNLNAVAMIPKHFDKAIASTGLCILRANRNLVDPEYLFCCATGDYFVATVVAKVRGANYPAVTDKDIKKVEIPIPPLYEQKTFTKVVEAARAASTLGSNGSCVADQLMTSLMFRFLGERT